MENFQTRDDFVTPVCALSAQPPLSQESKVNKPPLVFCDTETNGLFDDNNPDYVPEMLQICLKYQNNMFTSYISPRYSIPPGVTRINNLTSQDNILYLHGNQVDSVELSDCLGGLIRWLASLKEEAGGCKPILLAHNGFDFHFRILCHSLRSCGLTESARNVIGGFADTLVITRSFLQEEPYKSLRALSRAFLGINDLPNEAVAQATALERIFILRLRRYFTSDHVRTLESFL